MASSSTCTSENISPECTDCDEFKDLKAGLRILRTFLLCARKWGNNGDASLGALVLRTEKAISKWDPEIYSICHRTPLEDGQPNHNSQHPLSDFLEEIHFLQQEVKEWYIIFLNCSSRQSNNSPVSKDAVMDLMDSVLENLVDYHDWRQSEDPDVVQLNEALEEKLTFLKNLIRFLALRGIKDGQLGPLLTHTEAATGTVASLFFLCQFELSTETQKCIPQLLQKIIPVEPQVYEACIQALIASKLSSQSYPDTDDHILGDFINSLLCSLWEILKSSICLLISLRDKLQMLYEGLRSLRTILKERPKKFDAKMRNLTGLVVCDAGLVILALSLDGMEDGLLVKEMDLMSFDFLERIKLIETTVAEKCPETSSFNFTRTNELGFIEFVLDNLMDLTSPEASSIAVVSDQVQIIQDEFVFLHSFLGKIVELRNEDEELQALWDSAVEVAYRVEFLIDSLMIGDIRDLPSVLFVSFIEEIKIIRAEALKICDSKRLDAKVKEISNRFIQMPSPGSEPIINDVVVGFDDEAALIINRLTRGSRQVKIVSIVGMPGLGKTSLAKKVYDDSSIMSYFYTRAWCTVSQAYHKKKMLLQILTCIVFKLSDKHYKMTEEDLTEELYKLLRRNRYLIVLDDVWDIEAWNELEATFPDDANGSRVVLTSRCHDVAPLDKLDKEPHSLRQLTHDESWDLLKAKMLPGQVLHPNLFELRKQILEICQGLPLTIVIVAGILANADPDGWKAVVESLSSSNLSSTEQCIATIELSYKNLPDHLKPCFLYFGAFPEDHEHTAERLIWLWVAEGFVRKTRFKSLEDVANDYMMDLIGRSLVIVSSQRSIGGVKTCRIHDLLHEFCVIKAKKENFLQLVRGYDELYTLNVPHNLRRLCIDTKPEHFQKSRLFSPSLRSLLFFAHNARFEREWFDLSFIFCIYKLVRVLDLNQINLGSTFPREIGRLALLRYLAVRGEIGSIPSSIGSLSNLETFIMQSNKKVILPDAIWNLKKLRHLQIKYKLLAGFGCQLPTNNLDNAAQLCDLDTFSSIILPWEDMDTIFTKFLNIRRLKCQIRESQQGSERDANKKVLVVNFLGRLESLNLNFSPRGDVQYQIEFKFSLAIKKLTLSGFCLPWDKISAIANLPNLEVLKLLQKAFVGETWDMEEEKFSNVRFLKLASLDIVRWTAAEMEDYFPRLKKLVLERCRSLEEIPTSLGSISALEVIEVSDCPNCASSLEEIEEERMSMGYTDLKIITSSKRGRY